MRIGIEFGKQLNEVQLCVLIGERAQFGTFTVRQKVFFTDSAPLRLPAHFPPGRVPLRGRDGCKEWIMEIGFLEMV